VGGRGIADVKGKPTTRQLAKIAFADVGAAFDDRGALLPLARIPEGVRLAISSIETIEEFSGVTRKISFRNKVYALELLGKHLNLWVDVNISIDKMQFVAESMED
jgi:hypothetical protein